MPIAASTDDSTVLRHLGLPLGVGVNVQIEFVEDEGGNANPENERAYYAIVSGEHVARCHGSCRMHGDGNRRCGPWWRLRFKFQTIPTPVVSCGHICYPYCICNPQRSNGR